MKDRQMKFIMVCLLVGCFLQAAELHAVPLSQEALFHRCYGQITQRRPVSTNTLLLKVKSQQMSAIDACMSVIDRAVFTAENQTRIADLNDTEAKAALSTFHNLHASWFTLQNFNGYGAEISERASRDLFDVTSPALYYTRALFGVNVGIDSVLVNSNDGVDNENLRAVRTNMDPAVGVLSAWPKSYYIFGASTPLAAIGELLGVTPTDKMTRSFSYVRSNGTTAAASVDLGINFGGGALGNVNYALKNLQTEQNYQATMDGGVKTLRKYARNVFHDFLCQELPNIRINDTADYVVPNSTIAFRTSAGCVQCHASMDQMASVFRGIRTVTYGEGQPTPGQYGADFVRQITATKAMNDVWNSEPDSDFPLRPQTGRLYFRNYQGNLVNVSVNGPQQLGQAITATSDFYICAAKRYYEYFTGIDVYIGDLQLRSGGAVLSAADQVHRDRVIQLGLKLQTTKDIRVTISEILRGLNYANSDFN